MFTKIDKAIVALIMSALFLLNSFGGIDLGVEESTVSGVIAVLAPVLTYFVPNRV
jgi:hypothetical protein